MMDSGMENQSPPEWFEQVEFEAVAAELNVMLSELLANSSLEGDLGAVLTHRLSVSKFDTFHEYDVPELQYESDSEELSEITRQLSEQLKRILIENYGAPEEDVAYAVVRRWDMLAAAHNQCYWDKVWNYARQQWCSAHVCCF